MKHRGRPAHQDILTPREWEVLLLLREGLTNRQIGERIGVTRDGVKYHVANILEKLEVGTREEAAAWRPPVPAVATAARATLTGRLSRMSRLGLVGTAGALLCGVAALGSVFAYSALAGSSDNGSSSAHDVSRGGPPTATPRELPQATPSPVASVLARGEGSLLGQVAYVKSGNLWLLDLDTGADRMLVERTAAMTFGTSPDDLSAFGPEWSADGEWLAFGIQNEALAYSGCWMARAGDGLLEYVGGGLTGGSGWEWSPTDLVLYASGSRFRPVGAFADNIAANASAEFGTNVGYGEAKWSPDGRHVAVGGAQVSYRAGKQNVGPPYTVYIIDPEAARPTTAPGEQAAGVTPIYTAESGTGAPVVQSWSPDGKYVLFWDGPADSGVGQLTIQALDGSAKTGVTRPAPLAPSAAAWSPDGSRLAVVTADPATGGINTAQVMVFRNDGSQTWANAAEWSPGAGRSLEPAWSPDSSRLAYSGDGRIWMANADGANLTQLTSDDQYDDRYPQWSQDGQYILFVRISRAATDNGVVSPGQLWLMKSDGSDQHEIGDLPAIDTGQQGGFVDWGQYFSWYRPSGVAPMPTAPGPSLTAGSRQSPPIPGSPTPEFRID